MNAMTTASIPEFDRLPQGAGGKSDALPAFQVTKGNNFSAKTALGCILDEEERIALKPCIHAAFLVFSTFGQPATLTGFEPVLPP